MKHLLFFFVVGVCCRNLAAAQDIFSAARSNDTVAISSYLSDSGDLNVIDQRGYTPLMVAVYHHSYEAATWLIHAGALPDIRDKSGNTTLMGAAYLGYADLVHLLLEHHADVDMVNFNGASALFFAVTFGQLEVVKTLLLFNADTSIQDNRGKTALDYAIIQEHAAIMTLLK